MTTLNDLTDYLISEGIPIEGITENGTPHVIEGEMLTVSQIALIDSEFAIWDAQPPGQKRKSNAKTNAQGKATTLFTTLDGFTHSADVAGMNTPTRNAYIQHLGDTLKALTDNIEDILIALGIEAD